MNVLAMSMSKIPLKGPFKNMLLWPRRKKSREVLAMSKSKIPLKEPFKNMLLRQSGKYETKRINVSYSRNQIGILTYLKSKANQELIHN
jgi:hypothetical protein